MNIMQQLGSLVSASLIGWMAYSLLLGGVVTLAAVAAHDAQRAANRAVRWIWALAMLATVLFTVAAPWRRLSAPIRISLAAPVTGSLVPAKTPASASLMSAVRTTAVHARDAVVVPIEAALQSADALARRLPHAVSLTVAVAWLGASAITLLVFLVSYRRVRRHVERLPMQHVDDVAARIAPTVGPAVVGLAPSEIILPSWLLSRPADERRLVLAHESEHVRAHDPWLLVGACVAVALMPWHPALWYALSRLRLAVELDCDRRVLRRGIAPAAYGSLLIDLSAVRPAFPQSMPSFSMPAFACNSSYLERRLVAMTSRPTKFTTSRRVVGGMIAVAALITACESKLPTSAEIEKMDVAKATAEAKTVGLVGTKPTEYIVDDKKVSEDEAMKVSAERIATVNLSRTTGDAVQMKIRTRDSNYVTALDGAKSSMPAVVNLRRAGTTDSVRVEANGQPMTKRKFDGLLIVDGVITDAAQLEKISPDKIVSINVLKGDAASREYRDPRAVNGVIQVVTKK